MQQNSNKTIILKEPCPINLIKLLDLSKEINSSNIKTEKADLLKFLSECSKMKITKVENIFINHTCRFGNQLVLLNKVIFFCEVLGCKRIILNKNIYWFIKKKIIDNKFNIIIDIGTEEKYKNKRILIENSWNFFFYFKYLMPKFRPEVIKKELLRNIPKILVNPNDLYIYIRSGDIFLSHQTGYIQPPLCFYQTLLYNFTFNKIYIISQNKNNPVIDNILNQFPKISYKKNDLKYDIAYLIYAYNLVGAFSTFISYIIKYNDNLKYFWYFNFDIDNFYAVFFCFEFYHKVKRYRMNEADYYSQMRNCSSIEEQKKFMVNYKCLYKIYEVN